MAGTRRIKFKSLAQIMRGERRVSNEPDEQNANDHLPKELLQLVFSPLTLRDNIRASAVCKSWLAAAVSVRKANRSPWLMSFPESGHWYEFYDPSERKIYYLELPELCGSRLCYAKDGWLLLFRPRTQRPFFFCPYTRQLIQLPRLQLEDYKAAFSAPPTSSNCLIFTVRKNFPALLAISTCRPGEAEWTTINYVNHMPFLSSVSNKIVFCKGLFYCLSVNGWLGVYSPDKCTWTVPVPPPKCTGLLSSDIWQKGNFMVEHNGDIFVIFACYEAQPYVFKLDQTDRVWTEVESLGGMALFVNFFSSQAMSDLLGKMQNNIYFSKVLFYGRRCVTYSMDKLKYYPRKEFSDWGEYEPVENIWIEPPEDLSAFYKGG